MNSLNRSGGASAVPETRIHLGYLDALRGIAAVYVALFHASVQFPSSSLHGAGWRIVSLLCGFGHDAVDLFIVLSGFCPFLPIVKGDGTLRGGGLAFFQRRARRILPPYYFSVAVSLLLIALFIHDKTGTLWDNSVPVTRLGIVAHLLMLQDMFTNIAGQINHALWSVSVE